MCPTFLLLMYAYYEHPMQFYIPKAHATCPIVVFFHCVDTILDDADSGSDHQHSQEQVQAGTGSRSAVAMLSVTVSTVRSVTLITEAALQLHSSITHVGFITE